MPRLKFLLASFAISALLLGQTALVGASDSPYEHPFTDLEDSEWETAVSFIYSEGIVQGYSDGTYGPERTINRAELLKIILESRYDDIPEVNSDCGFSDVDANAWYPKYICFAKDEGIVEGYADGTFQPGKEVNFVEALKITELAYGWAVESDPNEWYRNYVEEAGEANVIPVSISAFDEELTRGAMADMIARFLFEGEDNLAEYLDLTGETDQIVTYECLSEDSCSSSSSDEDFEMFDPELTYDGAYNGPLFATWEHMGEASMDQYMENLDRNGVNYVLGFFSVTAEEIIPYDDEEDEEEDEEEEVSGDEEMLPSDGLCEEYDDLDPDCDENDMFFFEDFDIIVEAIEDNPYRIIPMFSPGYGGDEVEPYLGDELTTNYEDTLDKIEEEVGSNFMQGIGEIEAYAWNIEPTDSELTQLVDFAMDNDLFFMFHPSAGDSAEVEDLIESYPNTTFVMHMFPEDLDEDVDEYIEIMGSHDNLYFSVDADHMLFDEADHWGLLYKYENSSVNSAVENFVDDYDSMEDELLEDALDRFQTLIESVPDKVLWGTESYNEYNFEEEVYDRMIKFTRLFIAELDESVQEKFAYQNALDLFGEGASLD